VKILAVFLLICSTSQAAPKWLRRASAVAVCSAQVADIASTVGRREANPLLAGRYQQPRWGAIVPLKAGLCVGSVILAERSKSKSTVAVNFAVTGATGAVAVRNWRLPR